MLSIEELSTTMTKEEFIKYVDENQICPNKYGLPEMKETCGEGQDIEECHECWNHAVENITFKTNSLILFEDRGLEILKALKDSEETYKTLETQRDNLKSELLKVMEEYDIQKWENGEFSVTYIAPGVRTSVDSKKLLKEYPEIYSTVIKTAAVKSSVRFKIK